MSFLQDHPIGHAAYLTDDLDAACRRFSDIYDIDTWRVIDYVPVSAKYRGADFKGYHMKIAVHAPLAHGCAIEVIQPLSGGLMADFLARDRNRINHICHMTTQYDELFAHFAGKGCEVLFEGEARDERGSRRCVYFYDEYLATLIEVAEPPRKLG